MSADVEKFVRFYNSEFGKKVMEKEAEYVCKELRNCEQILDVGCGIGSFEQYLPNLNITGLDSSKEMLEEARKRSDKTFILGNAEDLKFKDSTFDAVFTVTTLEFLGSYKKAVEEIVRVTKQRGKILAMMLNPESEYFKEEIKKPGDYFKKVKHVNPEKIGAHISHFYTITKEEYFLGIRSQNIFDTGDKRYASLYVFVGIKK